MNISLNTSDLKRVENLLAKVPNGVNKALARATNEAATRGKTAVSRAVRSSFAVKAKEVASTLTISRASPSRLAAFLNYSGQKFPLSRFQIGGKSKGPVTIRELVGKTTTLASAFNVAQYGGNLFVRRTKKRFPLQTLMGLSVPAMVSGQRLNKTIEDLVQKVFTERAIHAAQVIAENFNKAKD
jgi:hypothetical protein